MDAIHENDEYADVIRVDATGNNILFSVAGSQGNVASSQALAEALQSAAPVMTDLHVDLHNTEPHITIFVPITDGGRLLRGR